MALSTCIKCGGTSFEVVEKEPRHSAFKLMFVQCSSCGGVVGVIEYENIGARLDNQDAALKKIANQLGVHVSL